MYKKQSPKAQIDPIIVPVNDSNVSLAKLCAQGKLDELKQRVQAGASVEEVDNDFSGRHDFTSIEDRSSGSYYVIEIAIECKNQDIITWLTDNKISLALQVSVDNLCEAIQTKELNVVKPIAKVVGAVYEKSSTGQTPLDLARNQKTQNIVKFLEKKTLFHIIRANLTELEIIQKLKTHLGNQKPEFFDETIQKPTESGNTSSESKKPKIGAVMVAAEKQYMRVIRWLVEKGANPNSESEDGGRLLAEINWNKDPENFKWLVNQGAEITSRNGCGKFALEKYVDEDNADVIIWAIKEKKFDIYEKNGNGLNLLTMILQEGKLNVFKALVEKADIDVNKKFSDANTLLHVAVVSKQIDIVKKLIEAKAAINVENVYGKTPIDIAVDMKDDVLLDLLVKSYAIANIRATDIDENAKIDNFEQFFEKNTNQRVQKGIGANEIINLAKNLKLDKLAQFLKAKNTAASIEGKVTGSVAPKLKEYNVLLIGETGVGKSTFINAFVNYISFANLDEAVKTGDPFCLIPSNFAITDDNYDRHVVTCGKLDENETFITGQSSTQAVKSYSIRTDKTILRLIDTPGIGDTRGLEKDQENFDKLLKAVAELENIHAICVMLRPNNSRLTVVFEYCIRELFAHLDRSASQNIVFLFTNSRGTFYRPGDTLPPLLSILKDLESPPTSVKIPFEKKNIFCMDNEAFRFLLAKKIKGVVFSEEEEADFAESWNKSAQVCRDFVKYLIKLPPHRIRDSTTINAARRIVLSLSKPLAEIAEHIDTTAMHLQEKKEIIERNKHNIEELKKKLHLKVPRLSIQRLKKPFTGCLHSDCRQVIQILGVHEEIPRVCHYPCQEGIAANKPGDPSIRRCNNIRVYCIECKHHFSYHVHLYYTKRIVVEELKDTVSSLQLQKNVTDQHSIEKLKRQLEDINNQYRSEEEAILSAMAKFSHFLKHNSIIVFHDACRDYIQELVDKEEKLGNLSNKTLLQTYRNILMKYERYFNDLEDRYAQVKKPVVTSADIFSEINKLKSLKNFGDTIKDVTDAQLELRKEDLLPNDDVKPRTSTLATLMDSIE
ncbi:50S ribosome-binding GTPase [Popillia japonica]|uniref:50S ribosome-binding GTPase n=1 Tax=Popillia japonica TaxID=7064 RepID=A0AAW1KI69_POPJA